MSALEEQILGAATRNTELLATLAKTDYAIAALKQQKVYMGELEAEQRRNSDKIKRLTISREKEAKDHHKYSDSVVKRFAYKATGQKEKFAQKASKEEREFFDALRAESRAKDEGIQLAKQIETAQKGTADLELVVLQNKQAQKALDALYNSIFQGETPSFPEEDQQENLTREALEEYQRLEDVIQIEKRVQKILANEEQAVRACAVQIDSALGYSTYDLFGGGAFADYLERSALGQADQAAARIYRMHDQARNISPHVTPLPPLNIAQGHLLGDILFDNFYSDYVFHQKIEQSASELKRAALVLRQNQDATEQRLEDLSAQMTATRQELEQVRKQLQKIREDIFERLSQELPQYSET